MTAFAGRKVLFLVENLPSPFDRRVWQEATALNAAGYTVSIICPTGKGCERHFEEIDGIAIHRYRLPVEPFLIILAGAGFSCLMQSGWLKAAMGK